MKMCSIFVRRCLILYIKNICAGFLFSNTGSETHILKCCEFAGWDSAEQFSFGPTPRLANTDAPTKPEHQQAIPANIPSPGRGIIARRGLCVLPNSSSVSVEKDGERHENGIDVDIDEEVSDDREMMEEAPRLRTIEKNLKILPGQKVSIHVDCLAK